MPTNTWYFSLETKKLEVFIFFSKNNCWLDIVLTRTNHILTTNEIVKLTIFWTTGRRKLNTNSTLQHFTASTEALNNSSCDYKISWSTNPLDFINWSQQAKMCSNKRKMRRFKFILRMRKDWSEHLLSLYLLLFSSAEWFC